MVFVSISFLRPDRYHHASAHHCISFDTVSMVAVAVPCLARSCVLAFGWSYVCSVQTSVALPLFLTWFIDLSLI